MKPSVIFPKSHKLVNFPAMRMLVLQDGSQQSGTPVPRLVAEESREGRSYVAKESPRLSIKKNQEV